MINQKNKQAFLIVAIAAISFCFFFVINYKEYSNVYISSFEECAASGNIVTESYPRQCSTKNGRHFVEKTALKYNQDVTLDGEITCLPKVDRNQQTMECAIGFLSEDGNYFTLSNMEKVDPNFKYAVGGRKLTISGFLTVNTNPNVVANSKTSGNIHLVDIVPN